MYIAYIRNAWVSYHRKVKTSTTRYGRPLAQPGQRQQRRRKVSSDGSCKVLAVPPDISGGTQPSAVER
jgi:hypothetical protein